MAALGVIVTVTVSGQSTVRVVVDWVAIAIVILWAAELVVGGYEYAIW